MTPRTIEYYFALASPWSYLGNDRLREIAAAHGAVIDPVIVDYDPMFAAAGTVPLPERPPLRKSYRLVELRRWSALRGVPLVPEPRHYRGEVEEPDERLAALMVTAARAAGEDSLALAHAISRALWAEERFPFAPRSCCRSRRRTASTVRPSSPRRIDRRRLAGTRSRPSGPSRAVSSGCRSTSSATSRSGVRTGWRCWRRRWRRCRAGPRRAGAKVRRIVAGGAMRTIGIGVGGAG